MNLDQLAQEYAESSGKKWSDPIQSTLVKQSSNAGFKAGFLASEERAGDLELQNKQLVSENGMLNDDILHLKEKLWLAEGKIKGMIEGLEALRQHKGES